MPHSTYDMCCLPLILLAWSFVSWFVFKFQFWLWQWRLLFTFVPSLNPCVSCLQRCVLYLPVSRLTQMSNTSYWACLCPDSDFPLSFLSHSWTFAHEFVVFHYASMHRCKGSSGIGIDVRVKRVIKIIAIICFIMTTMVMLSALPRGERPGGMWHSDVPCCVPSGTPVMKTW